MVMAVEFTSKGRFIVETTMMMISIQCLCAALVEVVKRMMVMKMRAVMKKLTMMKILLMRMNALNVLSMLIAYHIANVTQETENVGLDASYALMTTLEVTIKRKHET